MLLLLQRAAQANVSAALLIGGGGGGGETTSVSTSATACRSDWPHAASSAFDVQLASAVSPGPLGTVDSVGPGPGPGLGPGFGPGFVWRDMDARQQSAVLPWERLSSVLSEHFSPTTTTIPTPTI